MEIIYKTIGREDERQVRSLINEVINGLDNPEFFIPYEEWELERLFDENYAPINGAYVGNKLVGMTQLYILQDMLKEYKEILGLNDYKVCELGGALVLPEYRCQGIMTNLMLMQVDLAKKLKFDYVVSMAHPDNIASNKSLQKVGLKFAKVATVNGGFLRNTYIMKI